jgi:hypothetical protein
MSVSALDCSASVTTSCPEPPAPGSACHYKSMQQYRLAAGALDCRLDVTRGRTNFTLDKEPYEH